MISCLHSSYENRIPSKIRVFVSYSWMVFLRPQTYGRNRKAFIVYPSLPGEKPPPGRCITVTK
jgi:hypothetical protein